MPIPPTPIRRLAWATDLHLDWGTGRAGLARALGHADADALLVTGDIATHAMLASSLRRLAACARAPVFFVLGNHDAWGSSFRDTRRLAQRLHVARRKGPAITWLAGAGVVSLAESTALVGVDGLYDCSIGDDPGEVVLNDFRHIADLRGMNRAQIRDIMRREGAAAALAAESSLRLACSTHPRVIFATHAPPFPAAASWRSEPSIPENRLWFYAAGQMGAMLERVAADFPSTEILVLAGHTHGRGSAQIAPNLRARTGGATYGEPGLVDVLDVEPTDAALPPLQEAV